MFCLWQSILGLWDSIYAPKIRFRAHESKGVDFCIWTLMFLAYDSTFFVQNRPNMIYFFIFSFGENVKLFSNWKKTVRFFVQNEPNNIYMIFFFISCFGQKIELFFNWKKQLDFCFQTEPNNYISIYIYIYMIFFFISYFGEKIELFFRHLGINFKPRRVDFLTLVIEVWRAVEFRNVGMMFGL